MITEHQIRRRVRSHLRAALLREQIKQSAQDRDELETVDVEAALKDAMAEIDKIALRSTAMAKNIKVKKVTQDSDSDQMNESFWVTAYGTVISAAGVAKMLGYMAKGIAIVLKKLGAKVDPEKEGESFMKIGHWIHHKYMAGLEYLAKKMGFEDNKAKVAARVMFGVLLGIAMVLTGIGIYKAFTSDHLIIAGAEAGMEGLKGAEQAQLGSEIWTIIVETLQAAPELAGVAVDVAETAEEAVDAAVELTAMAT